MMDWVPCVGYGQLYSVPALSTTYIILYPVPDYIGDQELLYEDEVTTGLFLHRMVGTVTWASNDDIGCGWRLMPLGVEYSTISVLEPFAAPWSPFQSEWANLRWWADRWYQPTDEEPPQALDHPYWSHVDITPKQAFGQARNLWPVLAIRNNSMSESLRVRHRLRSLIS